MSGTNNESKIRTLKVYDKVFLRRGRHRRNTAVLYPEIKLIGKWLQDCGFEPGQTIAVITEHNKLTITPGKAKG